MAAQLINSRSLCENVIDNLMKLLRPCSNITTQYIFHVLSTQICMEMKDCFEKADIWAFWAVTLAESRRLFSEAPVVLCQNCRCQTRDTDLDNISENDVKEPDCNINHQNWEDNDKDKTFNYLYLDSLCPLLRI